MELHVSRRGLWLLCALALGLSSVPPAAASVYLKPTGQDAAPLRMKSVEAVVAIVDHVADTRTTLVFANETSDRIEADFMMTLPPGAIVTYFAYWYGEEKVEAQIWEKERAAAIYKHITTRQRDPALVEMVNRNTFRARIFPVMPDADLKVEMHFAQALPTDRQGAFYTFPLLAEDGDRTALDRIDLRCHVAPDPTLRGVTNNLGIPVEETGSGYTMALQGVNYRPTKDLRVNLVPVDAPPGAKYLASMYAARSGTDDGYFALTIVPGRDLERPVVRIRGLQVDDVLPERLEPVKAFGALHVFGRYKGSGPAVIEVRDRTWSGKVTIAFPGTVAPGNPASKLWAAEKIAALSENDRNHEEIVALSKRHNIPSKFTSWLAVPAEEMQRYWREALWGDAEALAGQLADEIDAGRGAGRKARELRATLADYGRRMGENPADFLRGAYEERLNGVASSLAREELENGKDTRAARDLRRRLESLSRRAGVNADDYLKDHTRNVAGTLAHEAAGRLAQLVAEGRGDEPEAARLRKRAEAMGRIQCPDWDCDYVSQALRDLGFRIAGRLAEAEYGGKVLPDADSLRNRLARLERTGGLDPGTMMRGARGQFESEKAYGISRRLATEIIEDRGEGETARQLRAELDAIRARADIRDDLVKDQIRSHTYSLVHDYVQAVQEGRMAEPETVALRARIERARTLADFGANDPLKQNLTWQMGYHAAMIVIERDRIKRDDTRLAQLERELRYFSEAAGEPYEPYIAHEEEPYRTDPLLRTRSEIIAERRKESPDPRRLAELEKAFLAMEPWRPEYVRARVERIAVEVELDKLNRIESPTAVQQAKRDELTRRQEELRARMGDPLIQIEAPKDAQQVIALMPDGTVKPLAWTPATNRWEARFDIPSWAAEGTYTVTVIVVGKDGARRTLTVRYHVDLTPPHGTGRAALAGAEPVLRLELDADADTARVAALLPWGEEVALGPSAPAGRFFALAAIPPDRRGQPFTITYVLTDKAHNRTTLVVATD